jgi:hypothetical protein
MTARQRDKPSDPERGIMAIVLFQAAITHGRRQMQMYASWVHGNACHIQRDRELGSDHHDDVYLASGAAGGILRYHGGAHLYIRARAPSNWKTGIRSGNFWVHYPIPTPVIVAGNRSVARELIVIIRWNSPDTAKITFDRLEV